MNELTQGDVAVAGSLNGQNQNATIYCVLADHIHDGSFRSKLVRTVGIFVEALNLGKWAAFHPDQIDIFEIELYVDWTIGALFDRDHWNVQRIQCDHIYITATV